MRAELAKDPTMLSGRAQELWGNILDFDAKIDHEVSGLD